jgi:hypothetical protein
LNDSRFIHGQLTAWRSKMKKEKSKQKTQKAHPQPYSRAGRVEVEWLRKTPEMVFTSTRLGVEPRTFSIYGVGVPGESRASSQYRSATLGYVAIERRLVDG